MAHFLSQFPQVDKAFHDIRAKSLTDKEEQQLNAQLAAGHTDPRMTARYIRNKKGRRFQPLKPAFDPKC